MDSIKHGRDELMGSDLRYFRLGNYSWSKAEKCSHMNYNLKYKIKVVSIKGSTTLLQNNLTRGFLMLYVMLDFRSHFP